MSTDTWLEARLEDAFRMGTDICKALGIFVYLYAVAKERHSPRAISMGKWVGELDESAATASRAPTFAPRKVFELMEQPIHERQLLMTPIAEYLGGTGYMGGVRYQYGDLDMTVGVSKLAQQFDKFIALIVLYNCIMGAVRLHHVGFRYPLEEEYLRAVKADRGHSYMLPASDHLRFYFRHEKWYREHQFFPDGPHDHARHLDFVVDYPRELLLFVSNAFGQKPEYWPAEPNSPVGQFFVEGDNEPDRLGLMARSEWWEIDVK